MILHDLSVVLSDVVVKTKAVAAGELHYVPCSIEGCRYHRVPGQNSLPFTKDVEAGPGILSRGDRLKNCRNIFQTVHKTVASKAYEVSEGM
jgi:hypothetical protein